ncbi:hypothetical protein ACOME3_009226 [Neoechinorhynchus agilis]
MTTQDRRVKSISKYSRISDNGKINGEEARAAASELISVGLYGHFPLSDISSNKSENISNVLETRGCIQDNPSNQLSSTISDRISSQQDEILRIFPDYLMHESSPIFGGDAEVLHQRFASQQLEPARVSEKDEMVQPLQSDSMVESSSNAESEFSGQDMHDVGIFHALKFIEELEHEAKTNRTSDEIRETECLDSSSYLIASDNFDDVESTQSFQSELSQMDSLFIEEVESTVRQQSTLGLINSEVVEENESVQSQHLDVSNTSIIEETKRVYPHYMPRCSEIVPICNDATNDGLQTLKCISTNSPNVKTVDGVQISDVNSSPIPSAVEDNNENDRTFLEIASFIFKEFEPNLRSSRNARPSLHICQSDESIDSEEVDEVDESHFEIDIDKIKEVCPNPKPILDLTIPRWAKILEDRAKDVIAFLDVSSYSTTDDVISQVIDSMAKIVMKKITSDREYVCKLSTIGWDEEDEQEKANSVLEFKHFPNDFNSIVKDRDTQGLMDAIMYHPTKISCSAIDAIDLSEKRLKASIRRSLGEDISVVMENLNNIIEYRNTTDFKLFEEVLD